MRDWMAHMRVFTMVLATGWRATSGTLGELWNIVLYVYGHIEVCEQCSLHVCDILFHGCPCMLTENITVFGLINEKNILLIYGISI